MPPLYIPTNKRIAVTGSIEKVKGRANATAMVAVNPGIAPTTTPISTPAAMAIKLSILRKSVRTSDMFSIAINLKRSV